MSTFGREMKSVAAIIRGHDNDTYMVGSCRNRLPNVPDSVFCQKCGWKIDWRFVRPDYRLGRRRRDVSATYDGVTIISQRVRDLLQDYGIDGAVFTPLLLEPGFFVVAPGTIVAFDCERRRTRLEEFCETCGLYGIVAGASPAFVKTLPEGETWIARTDILFGSYNEHHPLIVVSDSIVQALRKGRFSGLDLEIIKAEHLLSPERQ